MPNQGVIETNQMLFNNEYKIGVLPVDGENVIEGLRSNDSLANSWKSHDNDEVRSRNNSMDNFEINFNQDFNPNSDDESKKDAKMEEAANRSRLSGDSSWEFHLDKNSME